MKYTYIFLLAVSLGMRDAYAYLDPGTGSLIIQSIIAAFAGGIYIIKIYWYKVTSFFKKDKKEDTDSESKQYNEDKEEG